ncbi:MAG: hypothetical protein AABX04_08590 [Nanoarchaeota archaeon]
MDYLKVGGIVIVSILFVSVFTALFFVQPTGMGSAQLNSEQTRFYWKCLVDNKCGELLKIKDYTAYRKCSLECINQTLKPVDYFCDDPDGTDYLTKSKVVSNLYPQGKEDYCYTFPNGKTYLMEGICKNNQYAYVQKDCKGMGKYYTCKNGGCKKSAEEITLNLGDSVSFDDYTLKLVQFDDNLELGQFARFLFFQPKNGFVLPHPLSPVQVAFNNKFALKPYLGNMGLVQGIYLGLLNVDKKNKKVTVLKFNNCTDLVQHCLKTQSDSYCDKYCVYEPLEGETSYSQGPFIGFSPAEFADLNKYMIDSFNLCYFKIKNYTQLDLPAKNIYFKLLVDKSLTVGLGAGFDSIIWTSNDKNVVSIMQQMFTQEGGESSQNLKAGICPSDNAQGHELVHIFLAGTPIGIGYCAGSPGATVCAAFNEGLAEYLKYKVNGYQQTIEDEEIPIIDIGGPKKIICRPKGYSYSYSPETVSSYYNFSGDSQPDENFDSVYQTGLCMWGYIEKKYSHEVFLQILNKLDEYKYLPGELKKYKDKSGNYYHYYTYNILSDFIVPFTGEEILPVLKDRFGITVENTYMSIPRSLELWDYECTEGGCTPLEVN